MPQFAAIAWLPGAVIVHRLSIRITGKLALNRSSRKDDKNHKDNSDCRGAASQVHTGGRRPIMVRSLWLRALATTLVWTGVAWAQQPGSSATDKAAEQILTIQEAGKSPQKCRVVKSFRTSDGHQ